MASSVVVRLNVFSNESVLSSRTVISGKSWSGELDAAEVSFAEAGGMVFSKFTSSGNSGWFLFSISSPCCGVEAGSCTGRTTGISGKSVFKMACAGENA